MHKNKVTISLIAILILIFTNILYYYTVKDTLVSQQKKEIALIQRNIEDSINTTKEIEIQQNELLSRSLFNSSLIIKEGLPPRVKDISNEDVKKLTQKLDLSGILLIAEKENEMTVVKSSDDRAINVPIKKWWNESWQDTFRQLLIHNDIESTLRFNEKYNHFWTEPVDSSKIDKDMVAKRGFYKDKTIDYIISPYFKDNTFHYFSETIGINKTIKQQSNLSYIVEIGVINSQMLKDGEKKPKQPKDSSLTNRLVVYGDYTYRKKDDMAKIQEALTNKKRVESVIDGTLVKSYIPVQIDGNRDNELILVISSDLALMNKTLHNQTDDLLILSSFCCVASVLLIFISMRFLSKKETTIQSIQEMYSKNNESLFQTMKEYRHDFNHHIFTIKGLVNMKMHDDLEEYVDGLSSVQTSINDVVNVNNPALSGLLQAQVAKALEKSIKFEHHFENFEKIHIDILKVTDLVRVLGNIMDNAFHVLQEKTDNRKVTMMGKYYDGLLTISIHNNGAPIPQEHLTRIFEHGFTTREKRGGTGFGLSSSQKILARYKGTLSVSSDEECTSFTVVMPISQREIL